jgi:hypothetical protein
MEAEAAHGRRRRWPWVGAAGLVGAGAVFVLVWFQPQKLFIDDRVDEAAPTTSEPATPTGDPQAAPPTTADAPAPPDDLAVGSFVSLDHGTSGSVRVLAIDEGARVVRLEGLDTSNGPDLYLYLTTNPAAGDEGAFDDDYVSLGRLKGNLGDQNYELPADIDLARYGTVVIWCDRFDSAFGAADLSRAVAA